ncbi:hypothetical protein FSARC_11475 [Fusarium sarcochroum]|uniref:Nitrogen regulatory protein areA GATA-like domain-containing protein n=1 Tax=Fusarium sarcochroum TaxID=1208366 RepID=A0A8H4TFD6_9HYPO|nr:hypothetical protein FSARC_11475 [Fusarium sarcochroum]
MPYRLDTHVLRVDASVIHKVDTGNPANLYSMWTVFSRCADSVEQGRRLENLSWRLWRLWQRETFVVDSEEKTAPTTQTLPHNIPSEKRISKLPQLSSSVDSLVDEEAVEVTSLSVAAETVRPCIRRQDSCASTRSKRERHISSDDFEKMIVSIVKDKGPLSVPPQIVPVAKGSPHVRPSLEGSGSTGTERQASGKLSTGPESSPQRLPGNPRPTIVVHGFAPQKFTLQTIFPTVRSSDTIPKPKSSPAAKVVQYTRSAHFELGGSCSSSEQDQSLSRSKPVVPIFHKSRSQIGHSLEEDGSLESAIEDDEESSDWEDSDEESETTQVDVESFQRIKSEPNLTPRQSLLTLKLSKVGRLRNLGSQASQSTSVVPRSRMAYGPSLSTSSADSEEALMMEGIRDSGLKPIQEVPQSDTQPIMTGRKHNQPLAQALSPRTNRRKMLATELTESLRRHLLWERQQKSSTANAVLKRRHTSHDVANLKQYPEKPCMKKSEDVNPGRWNRYLLKIANDGYHSRGW